MNLCICIPCSTLHLRRPSLVPWLFSSIRMAPKTVISLFQRLKRLGAPMEAAGKKSPKANAGSGKDLDDDGSVAACVLETPPHAGSLLRALLSSKTDVCVTEQNEEPENDEGAVKRKRSSEVSADLVGQSCSGSKERDESASPEKGQVELTVEQRMRMQMNKAMAHARRNLRICEERVIEAQAQGLKYPMLVDLLVEKTWIDVLQDEFKKPYMEKLCQYVRQEFAGSLPIYPPLVKVFNAFNTCPFDKVKVVIIGQDPYHGPGQAMGLSFSVAKNVKRPTSLVNIFREIHDDLGCRIPTHGNLEKWAYQGVLLLNTVLTVREHHANSHAKKGWELFTDAAIRRISKKRSGVIFLLWGNSAQEKTRIINTKEHHILKASHPSGFSAHKGFFKCRHFSQANKIMEEKGLLPIEWNV